MIQVKTIKYENKCVLLIVGSFLSFILIGQEESCEGYWIERYEEWSFNVTDGNCCGKRMIQKGNARYLKVTSDSVFML